MNDTYCYVELVSRLGPSLRFTTNTLDDALGRVTELVADHSSIETILITVVEKTPELLDLERAVEDAKRRISAEVWTRRPKATDR